MTKAQRDALTTILPHAYPVTWKSFTVGKDAPIEWQFTTERAVAKLAGGYSRYFGRSARVGLGAGLSLAIVPSSLASAYGGRVSPGVAIYATVRPPGRVM